MMRTLFRTYFIFALLAFLGSTHADPLKLYVPYPSGWQLREPLLRDNVLTYEARQQINGITTQHLQITAISPPQGNPAPNAEALKQLASGLRDATLKTAREKEIPLHVFSAAQGYYYCATDKNPKPGDFTQMIEGVIVNQGYLINFTLLTNDAAGKYTQAMIAALDKLSIR